jgi:ribosome-binding factor A
VTVTGVEVTPDYAHAKVFFSQLMGDKELCLQGLQKSAGYLRTLLFKRLQIHTVPTLHFEYDNTTESAADMNALIARALATTAKED